MMSHCATKTVIRPKPRPKRRHKKKNWWEELLKTLLPEPEPIYIPIPIPVEDDLFFDP